MTSIDVMWWEGIEDGGEPYTDEELAIINSHASESRRSIGMTPISDESARVIAALDTAYPPTNPAVLLAAAREAYLAGDHRSMVRAIAWCLHVESVNNPGVFVTPDGARAEEAALIFAAMLV